MFADYGALWLWYVDDIEGFWTSIVDFYELPLRGGRASVLSSHDMPGARWFVGDELNYAEAMFRRASPDSPALAFQSERAPLRYVEWSELETSVAAVAAGLRQLG